MKPLLLFDIDKTLFDTENFSQYYRNKFIKLLKISPERLEKVRIKYHKSLKKHSDYIPEEFIKHLINAFRLEKQQKIYELLKNLFYESDNFSKNLFSDTDVLTELKKRYSLGIFSEGFPAFQKTKLVKSSLYDLFDLKNIFIFRRKTINEALSELPDQCTIVDDDPAVIHELLDQKTTILYPVWLNRKNKDKHPSAKTIHSLTELV